MAEAVVDRLEPVEVAVQHADRLADAEQAGEPLLQQAAVGQLGQRIVHRPVRQLIFCFLTLGNVIELRDDALNHAGMIADHPDM